MLPIRTVGWVVLVHVPGTPITVPVEYQPVGVMPEPVQGGHAEELIGERMAPFGKVQVRRAHGCRPFVSFCDEFVEVLVGGRLHGPYAEVVDDEQIDLGELLELPLKQAIGPGGVQGVEEFGRGGEQDIVVLADGLVADGLGDMALAGAAGPDDEDRAFSLTKRQVMRSWTREVLMAGLKSKSNCSMVLPDRKEARRRRISKLRCSLRATSSDMSRASKSGVGHPGFDGQSVPGLEGLQDADHAQLPEHGGEVGFRVHDDSPVDDEWGSADVAAAVPVLEQLPGIPAVSALAGVAVGEGIEGGFVGGRGIEPLFEDGLDGLVPGLW